MKIKLFLIVLAGKKWMKAIYFTTETQLSLTFTISEVLHFQTKLMRIVQEIITGNAKS